MKTESSIVFESPDGGKTIFARNFGEAGRVEWKPEMQYIEEMLEDILWKEIRTAAKSDDELQKLLDRAKVRYYLKKKDGG